MQDRKYLLSFVILLFGLSIPLWVLGAMYNIELFPGFKLFQLPLAMPMVAGFILTYSEKGRNGLLAMIKRSWDIRKIRPVIWYIPIFFVFPFINFLNYFFALLSGKDVPSPDISVGTFLSYAPVFFMTFAEEFGLTGYATDRLQKYYSALLSGLVVGVIWAAYHIPGFLISGFYTYSWIVWHAIYTIVSRVVFVWVYNNTRRSLCAMALLHWSFGLFWSFWPQDNLQRAVPFYDPRFCSLVIILVVTMITWLWGPKTLAD